MLIRLRHFASTTMHATCICTSASDVTRLPVRPVCKEHSSSMLDTVFSQQEDEFQEEYVTEAYKRQQQKVNKSQCNFMPSVMLYCIDVSLSVMLY